MPRGISRCPNCREPVSPFAAGCAICGADLEAARKRRAGRRRVQAPSVQLPGIGGREIEWLQVAIALLLSVAVSPIGLALSIYWAVQRHRHGDTVMTVLMVLTALIAVFALLEPFWFLNNLGI
jgi:hypothetical protein